MVITQTPLRVSLFGGGADYPAFYGKHGALVISAAIDKYIYVIAQHRRDGLIRAGYTDTELVDKLRDLQHELIREAIRSSGWMPGQGIEVNTMADIPTTGSGLGSSAAVTVGALLACSVLSGSSISGLGLAEIAYDIEALRLGRPCGVQDQHAVALGGLRAYTFTPNGTDYTPLFTEPWVVPAVMDSLLLFFTGTTRESRHILGRQAERAEDNEATLIEMQDIARRAQAILQDASSVFQIGPLLHESWQLKKTLAKGVSDPSVEAVYESALHAGATGGKLCGAGGGGYLLLFAPTAVAKDQVRQLMTGLQWPELSFKVEPLGARVVFDNRRPQ